jgi:hypothetical protein
MISEVEFNLHTKVEIVANVLNSIKLCHDMLI